ncbi:hypothetical protein GAR05_06161 [Micromonospora saelicesensis]|uniref:Uncharacterized protein n=1 Tax=Micromonospora saelicesensis TaxID=285676 RepID=A0ABX9CAK6_9ACTN|nr:hypothetical protein [Micromonospora saelicesensis]RAN92669.1 hypothetical protein GAR05_06161 [Micromonospora saelicesensis]
MTQIPSPESAASEPLFTVGALTAAVTAVLALLVAFGLPISDDQQAAVLGVVAVAGPLAVAALARGRVFSPATVARLASRR